MGKARAIAGNPFMVENHHPLEGPGDSKVATPKFWKDPICGINKKVGLGT